MPSHTIDKVITEHRENGRNIYIAEKEKKRKIQNKFCFLKDLCS